VTPWPLSFADASVESEEYTTYLGPVNANRQCRFIDQQFPFWQWGVSSDYN
jgi:hypothetical protein